MSTKKKVAFITGGNRGLGFATAKALAKQGVHVVIGARKEAHGRYASQDLIKEKLSADFIVFDALEKADHIKAANFFMDSYGKLDILVNNAGVFLDAENASSERINRTSTTSEQILRQTFDLNFFAVVSLTQKLLPLLKMAPAGRIVNVSSILGSLNLHADPKSSVYNSKLFSYDASKTALNAFTIHLAHELRDTRVKVNSAHPGWVKTDMGGASALLEPEQGAETPARLALLPDDGPSGGFFFGDQTLPW